MGSVRPMPSGREVRIPPNELIVSKTDTRGVITYANPAFVRICGYSEEELLGHPHAIIRHPDMPRCVFRLLWETIQSGHEIFAFVVNLCKSGDHYWVFAHVTPDFDPVTNTIVGYHSSRRAVTPAARQTIEGLYAELLKTERSRNGRTDGMRASGAQLDAILEERGVTYEQFIFECYQHSSAA